ncbi:hypothetical protein MNB_SUP05-SYMBIONT-4-693 [hydrothermal vent metagenome]|uniref:Uncharacterized protein n=1 Tax=hydrothermal vent metagenome TaxID=652676 RepID=A0A1W1E042_9ZZZZ
MTLKKPFTLLQKQKKNTPNPTDIMISTKTFFTHRILKTF